MGLLMLEGAEDGDFENSTIVKITMMVNVTKDKESGDLKAPLFRVIFDYFFLLNKYEMRLIMSPTDDLIKQIIYEKA
jgi:hypothetical protein